MKATVLIRPKEGILDPQGEAVGDALRTLGFAVTGARVGRLVDVELQDADPAEAQAALESMARNLLANPLIESFTIEVEASPVSDASRIAVVTFPGSNDDGDAALALELLGAEPVRVWHADHALPEGTEGVILPGGFSYGDYLRCGAIARFAPVMESVSAFAGEGGPVLGICNGFQILCEAGLLPGVLRLNRQQQFLCADVTVTVESTTSVFAGGWAAGDELVIPIKHGEGNWYGDADLLASLEANGQIAFRYSEDVNGALDRIAGVTNDAGNVLGLMPHPEHAVEPLLGPTGGVAVLEGLIAAARERAGAVA